MAVRNKILFSVSSVFSGIFSAVSNIILAILLGRLILEIFFAIFGYNFELYNIYFQASYSIASIILDSMCLVLPFGLMLIFNLVSRKKGKSAGCISPAYAFVYSGVTGFIYAIIRPIFFDYYYDSYYQYRRISLVMNIIIELVILFIVITCFVILFIGESKNKRKLYNKIIEEKKAENPVLAKAKMFSGGRIFAFIAMILVYIIYSLLNCFYTPRILHFLSGICFIVLCFAFVLICNLIAGKKNPQNKIPAATMFIPAGVGFVTSIFNNIYTAVYYFSVAYRGTNYYKNNYYHYSDQYAYFDNLYYDSVSELNQTLPFVSLILGAITLVVFLLLVFRHEKKNYEAMLNDKYYGKKKEKPAPAPVQDEPQTAPQVVYQQPVYVQPVQNAPQAQGQPVYGQPVQVVYLQPGQIIPGQPVQIVYQQPDQPVYGQPVQVVYQQPVQPENTAYMADEPTIIMNDDATAVMNSDSFTTNGNNNNQ